MKEEYIRQIINKMVSQGCDFTNFPELYTKSISLLRDDRDILEIFDSISTHVDRDTHAFLKSKNEFNTNYISGISSCIYLPSTDDKGEYKLTILGGNRSRLINTGVDERTLFDIASITKLFTLVLIFRLEKLGLINLDDRISSVNPKYEYLEDFTFNDLIRLHGEVCTNGRIADAKDKEEAWNMMHEAYLKSNSRSENKYTDMGAIIMSDTICKIINEKTHKNMNYGEIMDEYLFKEIGITHPGYIPNTSNVAGNFHLDNLPHDPKARILGMTGHAGLFLNSDDICKLAKAIMCSDLLTDEQKRRLGETTFPNSNISFKGNLGVFLKTPVGLDNSYTPREYSTGSFSHQGWTGSVATFDPNNLIHQNILTSSIISSDYKEQVHNDKPTGFAGALKSYELRCVESALLAYIVKEYYERYLSVSKDYTKVIKF